MIQIQFLNALLDKPELWNKNSLTEEHFSEYKEEFNFIAQHQNRYGNIPDKATFASKFTKFEFFTVRETERYLIDELMEDLLYRKVVPIILECEKRVRTDANDGAKFLLSKLKEIEPKKHSLGTDARNRQPKDATKRIEKSWKPGLTEIAESWQCGEELVTIVGRLGQGKTWLALEEAASVYVQGGNPGIYSGEMSEKKVLWRMDSLLTGISNRRIRSGKFQDDEEQKAYENYLAEMQKKENAIYVCTPKDFGRRATVSDLPEFVRSRNIDILIVDHYGLMFDEKWGKNKKERLENIIQGLWDLTTEMGIPIIGLAQSNREGAKKEDGPDADNIAGADEIGQFSSRIFSISQPDKGKLLIVRKKDRDDDSDVKFAYLWDIDVGKFTYVPSDKKKEAAKVDKVRREYKDAADVF